MQAIISQPVLAASTVPGSVNTSWFGNSFVMDASGAPKWANNAVGDIWVAPDGTLYTNSEWDECAQEGGIYKNGDKIGALNNTHGVTSGRAITGNANHVFLSTGNSFLRWSRATKNPEGSPVDTGGLVWGLGADATCLFVGTDANGGRIRVYNPTTMAFVSEWAFVRPGGMSVDSGGNVWVLQRSDSSTAPQAVQFSPAGTQLATITFPAGVDPTGVAADGISRVLVADGGPDQNVKIYNTTSLSGSPTAVSDTLGTVGGIFAVGGGYVKGQAGPSRFDEPTGVGVDSSGNYYVSSWGPVSANGAATHNGSAIESYSDSKTRLWRVFGLEFEDCGDIDPTDPNVIYTKDGKYTVNWDNGLGQEVNYWGTTLDHVANPKDPRTWINMYGNNNAGSRVVSAGGRKFLYVWDQQSGYMQVYRFVGEVAVLAVMIKKNGGGADSFLNSPASTDSWVGWIWQDTDQDGQFDANEYASTHDNPYMFGWHIDTNGNIWKGMRESGIRKFTLTVDANGMPTYSTVNSILVANPAPFNTSMGDIRRVHHDTATDTMYIMGFNDFPSEGAGAGNLMGRYPNWSAGNRIASQTISLPYTNVPSDISQNATTCAMDVAGEYMFVAYFDPGAARIRVYQSSDLAFVGEITADRVNGQIYGTDVDTPNGVNAFVRSNGEYVILQSNYGFANQLMFRWSPAALVPAAPTGLTAAAGSARAVLSWSVSSGATSYTLKRAVTTGGPYTDVANQTGTSYTDTGLTNGKAYYYVVSASKSAGPGANSVQTSAIPDAANANLILNSRFSADTFGHHSSGPGGAITAWGFVAGSGGWWAGTNSDQPGLTDPATFAYARNGAAWTTSIAARPSIIAGTSYTFAFKLRNDYPSGGVFNGGTVALQWFDTLGAVIATDSNTLLLGNTAAAITDPWASFSYNLIAPPGAVKAGVLWTMSSAQVGSDFFLGTVDIPTTPAAPTSLTATAGNAQVALSWTASGGTTGYTLKRATTSGGPYTDVVTQAGTSYTHTGLTNGTTYYYVVSSSNAAGSSANSTQFTATPADPPSAPAAPTSLNATGGNAQVALSWTVSSGATGYTLKRATTSGGPYTDVVTQAGTEYTNTGLTNGATCYYLVCASNIGGTSANSSQASATPLAPPMAPAAPTNLTATGGNAQVVLSWTAASGATGYAVKTATTSGGPYTDVVTQAGTAYTHTGLTNGTVYYYVVSAINTVGSSANSAQASATPTLPLAGLLSVASATITTPINLTTIGTADWTKWGVATTVATVNRKSSGGTQISNYTKIGTGAITRYTDSGVGYSWADGTPTKSGSNNLTGIHSSAVGTGFSITIPANMTTRTLNLYVGGWNSTCELTAVLSNGSAGDYTAIKVHPSTGDTNTVYSITYNAAASNQTLTVTWKMTAGTGECMLHAATLMVGTVLANGAIYEIEPIVSSGKRIDVSGLSTVNGTALQIWTDSNGNNQRWMLQSQGTSGYELIPQHATGQRMDVENASTTDGAKVQIWSDTNGGNQRWQFEVQADGSYEIIPRHDLAKRLKVNGGSTASGTWVQSWPDDNSSAVRWRLIKQ